MEPFVEIVEQQNEEARNQPVEKRDDEEHVDEDTPQRTKLLALRENTPSIASCMILVGGIKLDTSCAGSATSLLVIWSIRLSTSLKTSSFAPGPVCRRMTQYRNEVDDHMFTREARY